MNPDQAAIGRPDEAGRGYGFQRIPRFSEGDGKPLIFSASDMNRLVDAVNRLLALEIRRGTTDMVIHTDSQVIIQLAFPKGDLSAVTAS